MTPIALLVLAQTASPAAVLERYAAYRATHSDFTVTWQMKTTTGMVVDGQLTIQGRKRLRIAARSGNNTYSLSETEKGIVELSPGDADYDEAPPYPRLIIPSSRVSGLYQAVPGILVVPDLRDSTGQRRYEAMGQAVVEGDQTDVVSWKSVSPEGTIRFELAIDATGRLRQFVRSLSESDGAGPAGIHGTVAGSVTATWTFRDYQPAPNLSLAAFLTPIPKGYVPYAIPTDSALNLAVDGKIPSIGWVQGGRSVSLDSRFSGHAGLLVVTDPTCGPSQKALAILPSIRQAVVASGGVVELASLSRTAPAGKGFLYNPSGDAEKKLGSPATPLFVLVDSKGKITNMWSGFDSSHSGDFLKQVRDAVQHQGTK